MTHARHPLAAADVVEKADDVGVFGVHGGMERSDGLRRTGNMQRMLFPGARVHLHGSIEQRLSFVYGWNTHGFLLSVWLVFLDVAEIC